MDYSIAHYYNYCIKKTPGGYSYLDWMNKGVNRMKCDIILTLFSNYSFLRCDDIYVATSNLHVKDSIGLYSTLSRLPPLFA